MARIYRMSERIPVKIGPVTVTIAPMSFAHKTELQTLMMKAKDDPMQAIQACRMAVKFGVKAVSGVEDAEGEYTCALDEDGCLTDTCVDELMTLEEGPRIVNICSQLIAGIPRGFVDAEGKPVPDVAIVSAPASGKKPRSK